MKKIIYIILLLTIISCTRRIPLNKNYQGPKPIPIEILNEFDVCGVIDVQQDITMEFPTFNITKITFPSCTKNQLAILDYYKPKSKSKKPVILVIPPLGGDYITANLVSTYLVMHDYAAIIIHRQPLSDFENVSSVNTLINNINESLKQIIINHKQVIDWIEVQPDIDPNRIGIIGTSMGGIKTSIISPLDKRIKSSIIVLGGGDIPYILTYTKEKGITDRRDEFLKTTNLSQELLYSQLYGSITYDPLNLAQYLDARNTLMVLAVFDKDVPYIKGDELRKYIGGPETILLFSDHLTSIPYIFHIEKISLEFFNKTLK